MKVVVTVEARFFGTPDGRVWCDNQFNFPHAFWGRYLTAFDEVEIVARVAPVRAMQPGWREVTGPQVTVHGLPYYLGPKEYLQKFFAVRNAIAQAVKPNRAYVFRVGSVIADTMRPHLLRHAWPYAVEVVGDPWDMFGPGGIKHRLRPFFRWWFTRQLKKMCRHASAASYVTERLLQERYPAPDAKLAVNASSIVLGDEAIAQSPRDYRALTGTVKLITVGSLEHPHKGTDLLIEAVSALRAQGVLVELSILGDGRMRADFEALAQARKVSEAVHFLGTVPGGQAVRDIVARHDMFVLPSRADGMPRAMIEAMALGLFCIGTRVGGMQELLAPEWLAPVNDAGTLAQKIQAALDDRERMNAEVKITWERAKGYHTTLLEARRKSMYQTLRKVTSEAKWKP